MGKEDWKQCPGFFHCNWCLSKEDLPKCLPEMPITTSQIPGAAFRTYREKLDETPVNRSFSFSQPYLIPFIEFPNVFSLLFFIQGNRVFLGFRLGVTEMTSLRGTCLSEPRVSGLQSHWPGIICFRIAGRKGAKQTVELWVSEAVLKNFNQSWGRGKDGESIEWPLMSQSFRK